MSNTDVTKTCVEKGCGSEFVITEGEKKFFESKDMPLPKRCKPCREKRRMEKTGTAFTN